MSYTIPVDLRLCVRRLIMDTPEKIEELAFLEELKTLRKKLNELIIDREIALAVEKANHDGKKEQNSEE